jgi:hypothetical protein
MAVLNTLQHYWNNVFESVYLIFNDIHDPGNYLLEVLEEVKVWESAAHFKKAVSVVMDPHNNMSAYPPSTVASPHLFKKVAVPGICVD